MQSPGLWKALQTSKSANITRINLVNLVGQSSWFMQTRKWQNGRKEGGWFHPPAKQVLLSRTPDIRRFRPTNLKQNGGFQSMPWTMPWRRSSTCGRGKRSKHLSWLEFRVCVHYILCCSCSAANLVFQGRIFRFSVFNRQRSLRVAAKWVLLCHGLHRIGP